VPQSWFSKREPMRGDLHHLFACEARCNSFRGNTPYADFPDAQERQMSDCGRSEPQGF
jgi:endonuclease G, mitochondrial